MENWSLRKSQTARIVGTADPYRLRDALRDARGERRARAVAAHGAAATWQSIGPSNVPGRIGALSISRQDSQVLYAGSAAGGVFKTSDGGATWNALWSRQDSLAVGGLAVAPSDHDVVYAATGEWEGGVSSTPYHHFPGIGVYRTIDGGQTWSLCAIPSLWTSAVVVDPADPDRAFVAGDASLHRSRDGGRTWDTAPGNANGVFCGTITDVQMDPGDPARVYVGVHRSGVWRSVDGGDHWTRLPLPGLAESDAIAPKLALCRRPSGSLFVAVLSNGSVFTSADAGDTFARRSGLPPVYYASWCTAIAVDSSDPDVLLAGHVRLFRSSDGGQNWTKVGLEGTPESDGHSDQQAIVFDPGNHDRVYVATDGGVFVSSNNGRTWAGRSEGLMTAQCYTVAASRAGALRIGITTQDNHVYQSDGGPAFTRIARGEGGWIEYDPTTSRTVYVDTRSRGLEVSRNGGAEWDPLSVDSDATIREALSIARSDPRHLLVVDRSGRLRRSTDGGTTWTAALDAPRAVLRAVEFAPSDARRAYAATGDGCVWCSDDGGATWHELEPSPFPPFLAEDRPRPPANDIEIHPQDPRRIFVAFGSDDLSFGIDMRAVWRGDVTSVTTVTWTDISGTAPNSLPARLPITALVVDPAVPDTLYAAHLLGVHKTVDGGRRWTPFDDGLPNCFVSDLDVHEPTRTLYLATMGRGLYRAAL